MKNSTMSPVLDAPAHPSQRVLVWVDHHRWWLLAAVLALYAAGINGQWRIGSDSAVHVSIARSLAQTGRFVHPTGREAEVHPGLAYLIAANFRVFGEERGLTAVNVVMPLIGLAGVALTFVLVRLHCDRPTAVLVALMVTVAKTHYRNSFAVLTDMPFAVGGLTVLVGIELLFRRATLGRAAGAAMVVAGLLVMAAFRSVFATFIAALLATLLWQAVVQRGRRRWLALAGAMIGAGAAAGIWRWVGAVTDENVIRGSLVDDPVGTLTTAVTVTVPKLIGEIATEAVIAIDWGWAVGVPVSLFIVINGLLLVRTRVLWGVLVAVFSLQWSLFLVTERYLLPILPLLALGWWRGSVWLSRRVGGGAVLAVMLALFVVPNLYKVSMFLVDQRRTPFLAYFHRGRYEPWERASAWVRQHTPRDTVIVMDEERSAEVMAMADRVAVHFRRLETYTAGGAAAVMIEPIESRAHRQLERRGWAIGDVLYAFEDRTGTTWTVRQLVRAAAEEHGEDRAAEQIQVEPD